jgi:hypothetical protein
LNQRNFLAAAFAAPWVLACATRVAQADDARPIRVRLSWTNQTAGADCLNEAGLAKAVELRLRRTAFTTSSPDLLLDGAVVQERGKRVAKITVRRADGELVGHRELESPDPTCATLNEAAPLSIALMIDYQQRVLRLHLPAIEAVATPTSQPKPSPAPGQPTPPAAKTPWQFGSRAGGAVEAGMLPGLSWSTRIALEASRGWPSLRMEAAWVVPRSAAFDAGDATMTGWTVGVAGCGNWLRKPTFHSALCLGGEGGRLLTSGARFQQNRDGATALGVAWLGVDVFAHVAQDWGLSLGLQGGVPVVRQRFEYTSSTGENPTLFESFPVFGRLSLSIAYVPRPVDQKSGR